MMAALVEIEGLRIRRGEFELVIDRWTMHEGEIVGLVGPNGSGKTTLLLAMHGLIPLDDGVIRVLGRNPWTEPVEVRSRVGFASEDVKLFPLTPARLLKVLADYYPGRWDDALCDSLSRQFELPGGMVGSLSRGEGIRV